MRDVQTTVGSERCAKRRKLSTKTGAKWNQRPTFRNLSRLERIGDESRRTKYKQHAKRKQDVGNQPRDLKGRPESGQSGGVGQGTWPNSSFRYNTG